MSDSETEKVEVCENFVAFPAIGSLASVAKLAKRHLEKEKRSGVIEYRGKVKLHGSNGGVHVYPDGKVQAQSRTKSLYKGGNDNAGFGAWVYANSAYFAELADADANPLLIYGEWCGKGIQANVSISDIGRRVFCVFSVHKGCDGQMIIDPDKIEALLAQPKVDRPADLFVLPWYEPHAEPIPVDFAVQTTVEAAETRINTAVYAVEKCDPFVKEQFKVDGMGEGLVYYPVSMTGENGHYRSTHVCAYLFKAKGSEHQVVRSKKPAEANPEAAASIQAFVTQVTTTARLEQALTETGAERGNTKMIGKFVGWMSADVKKDVDNKVVDLPEGAELKTVTQAVTKEARAWFMKR